MCIPILSNNLIIHSLMQSAGDVEFTSKVVVSAYRSVQLIHGSRPVELLKDPTGHPLHDLLFVASGADPRWQETENIFEWDN